MRMRYKHHKELRMRYKQHTDVCFKNIPAVWGLAGFFPSPFKLHISRNFFPIRSTIIAEQN